MATSFPTGLDVLTNPTSADTLASPDHAAQHANVNDAVEAIEAQIGTTASPVLARLASPTFTGTPTLPTGTIATTQTAADSSTKVATTAFVTTADNLKANLASPTFTGVPLSTTAAVDTNTTQVATTAYVVGQGYAKLASPTFTGTPAAPTAAVGTNTTQLATTEFVLANNPNFGFVSTFYYRPNPGRVDAVTTVVSSTYYLPFHALKAGTFDRVAIQTSSTYVGTGAVRMGIYNNDVATNKPSTVILDAGTVATTAASTIYEITISQTLPAGVYWMAFNMQTAPATPRYTGTTIGFTMSPLLIGTTAAFGTNAGAWVETGITGAFTTAGTLATSTIAGSLSLRAS